MSTIRATYVQHGSSAVPNITLNASGEVIVASGLVSSGTFAAPSGTAAAPGVYFVGDADTGLYSPGANQVAISTNGSGRLFINSTGDIQVGAASTLSAAVLSATANPASKNLYLAFNGTTTGADFLMGGISANANGTNIGAVDIYRGSSDDHGYISFRTKNGTTLGERLRITADGKVGLGTSSPNTNSKLHIAGANSGNYLTVENTTAADGDGTRWSYIVFEGTQSGGEVSTLATLNAEHDGTADDEKGRLVFKTNDGNDGASPTEHMRIKASGEIAIGEGGVNTSYMSIRSDNAAVGPLQLNKPTTTGKLISFYSSSSFRGDITTDGSTVAYNTSSDYRLKENVTSVTDGITRLQQLKPSRFNFITDPGKTVDGFIAHEVQAVIPEAVTGEKDAVDDEGNPQYQGIDQSKLVPLLTAALQEAIGEIESLKARVAELETQ